MSKVIYFIFSPHNVNRLLGQEIQDKLNDTLYDPKDIKIVVNDKGICPFCA